MFGKYVCFVFFFSVCFMASPQWVLIAAQLVNVGESASTQDNTAAPDALSTKSPKSNACNGVGHPDFVDVIEKVVNGVVSVVVVQTAKNDDDELGQLRKQFGPPFDEFFKHFGGKDAMPRKVHAAGSGFFIKIENGAAYVATNSHIVENAIKVKVILWNKTEVPAVVHGVDQRNDIAVLRVDLKDIPGNVRKTIVVLKWGDSNEIAAGQWVIAIGNPFGLANTVTNGIISAKARDLNVGGKTLTDDFIQHSAPINTGNSGGCLVNMNAEVIGINTIIVTPSGGNVGIGFAIPSGVASRITSQLISFKKVQHGALGVSVQNLDKDMAEALGIKDNRGGAVVAIIEPDSPAAKAGIMSGDIIIKFDDIEITSMAKLSRVVGDAAIETRHKVLVFRKGKKITFDVVLGDLDKINGFGAAAGKKTDATSPVEILGMTLIDSIPHAGGSSVKGESELRGALIAKVAPDSAAEDVGLVKGDVIVSVNQQSIASACEFVDFAIKALSRGERFLFISVSRNGTERFLSIRINEDEALKKLAEGRSASSPKAANGGGGPVGATDKSLQKFVRPKANNEIKEAGRDSSKEAGRDGSREAGSDSSKEAGRDSSKEAGRDSSKDEINGTNLLDDAQDNVANTDGKKLHTPPLHDANSSKSRSRGAVAEKDAGDRAPAYKKSPAAGGLFHNFMDWFRSFP
jgi:serine protease Do